MARTTEDFGNESPLETLAGYLEVVSNRLDILAESTANTVKKLSTLEARLDKLETGLELLAMHCGIYGDDDIDNLLGRTAADSNGDKHRTKEIT